MDSMVVYRTSDSAKFSMNRMLGSSDEISTEEPTKFDLLLSDALLLRSLSLFIFGFEGIMFAGFLQ